MASGPLYVKIHVAWWVKPYVVVLALFAALHGAEVDADKLVKKIRRGLKFSLDGKP